MDVPSLLEELKMLSDITEVEMFIEQHAKAIGMALYPDQGMISSIPDAFKVSMDKVTLNHYTVNKHSSPLGKKKNISRNNTEALYYPAITGKLILQNFNGPYPYFGLKRILEAMNIHVRQYKYRWDFTMWVDDFPQLGVMWVLTNGRIKNRDDETLDIVT